MIFSSIGFSTVNKFLKDNNIELNNDGTDGLDVDHQLVEVGALLDARGLDRVAHAAHRAEGRVQHDAADRARFLVDDARGGRHVAPTVFDLQLHVDLAARGEMRDDVIGIDDLDIVGDLDVGPRSPHPHPPS